MSTVNLPNLQLQSVTFFCLNLKRCEQCFSVSSLHFCAGMTHTQTETEVLNKFSQLSTEICFVWHFMFQVAPPKGGRVGYFFASLSFWASHGVLCIEFSGILRGTIILVIIHFGCQLGQFGIFLKEVLTLRCVVFPFWAWVICNCFVGPVTGFTRTAGTFVTDWMNTED